MSDFEALLILALMLALGFLCYPLFFKTRAESKEETEQRKQANVQMFKDRQQELDVELSTGKISEGEHKQLLQEMQAALLIDVSEPEAAVAVTAHPRKGWWLLMALIVLVPAATLLAYKKLGAADEWYIQEKMAEFSQQKNPEQLKQLIGLMEQSLQRRFNMHYAAMLGQYHMQGGRFPEAAHYYRELAERLPQDADAQAYYAQALYLVADQQMTPEVEAAAAKALQLEPEHALVLGMLAMHDFQQQRYQQAIITWRKLLAKAIPGSSEQAMLRGGIEEATRRLQAAGESVPEPESKGPGLVVSVALDDVVSVDSDALVFILAKAVSGPPMPLAVQRVTLAELPTTVVLDDSQAMVAGMTLSAFNEVDVIARVSNSGQPMRQPGDWEASSRVKLSDVKQKISLTIRDQVK